MSLREHTLTAKKDLHYSLSDDEWASILKGENVEVPFHPMWMPSGFLVAFIGQHPTPEDPHAQEIMEDGGSCCRFPITEVVRKGFEKNGAWKATYGPFTLTVVLESTLNRIRAEKKAKAVSRQ